jgi:exo-beta-1,3-glucanase (GH17 family)
VSDATASTSPRRAAMPTGLALLACLGLASTASACGGGASSPARPTATAELRPLALELDGAWRGHGICYGPHRDGQRPGGVAPTDAELREDLALLAPRWELLRIYGADDPAERLLAIIRHDRLPLRVLLGAWIAPEVDGASAATNRAQIASAVRLASAYPEVVAAVVVGNETQVSWSDHKVDLDVLIGHVRVARAATTVPVTVADDFAFWLDPASARLARELDLVITHVHPMWNGAQLDDALAFTQGKYAAVAAAHPDRPIFLGEVGWATRRHTEGDQGKYIKGVAGEAEQARFYEQLTAWTTQARIGATFFEAFDENWKGGDHPDEVEKHWGLFRADRTPKAAMTTTP